jgi:hypothetical protein
VAFRGRACETGSGEDLVDNNVKSILWALGGEMRRRLQTGVAQGHTVARRGDVSLTFLEAFLCSDSGSYRL